MTSLAQSTQDAPSEVHLILQSFVEHLHSSPVRGRRRVEQQMENMWILGAVEGASIAVTVLIGRMFAPDSPQPEIEMIRSSVVIPLVLSGDLAKAELKLQEMIARSWNIA